MCRQAHEAQLVALSRLDHGARSETGEGATRGRRPMRQAAKPRAHTIEAWPTPTPSAPARRSPSAAGSSRCSGSARCSRATTSPGCRTRCASCSRTFSAARTASRSPRATSRRWRAGTRRRRRRTRSTSTRPASSCRTSPACRRSSTSRRCAAAMADLGGDPQRINPLIPVELVIDHSVQVDDFATPLRDRAQLRARVRAQPRALRVPPLGPGRRSPTSRPCRRTRASATRSTSSSSRASSRSATGRRSPTRVVGTDSHTTMVNGLGVLGWGVGGIEAEAAMLGEAISMLVPQVVGFRLHGALPEGLDGDRPRPHRDADPAPDRRRREVRRVLRPRAREPPARRPRHDREHVPGVRRDMRLLPGRRRDAPLPAPHRAAARRRSRSSRRTAGRTASGTTRTSPRRTRRSSSSTSRAWSRRSPARGARRTACRCTTRGTRSSQALPLVRRRPRTTARRRGGRGVDGRERPARRVDAPTAAAVHRPSPARASTARRSRSTTAPS